MKKLLAALAASLVLGLALTSTAVAAVEFGSNCTGAEVEPGLTILDLEHSGSEPLATTAPISGVITQGKTSFQIMQPIKVAVTLRVYRRAGPGQFTLVGEGSSVPVAPGSNAFPTRVPIQTGDYLGLSVSGEGESIGLACRTQNPADHLGYTSEPPQLGGTQNFGTADEYRTPLAAVIEPDADNDGYGDVTQDGCPQSATVQTACPLIELDASASAGRKAVVVKVAASSAGTVGVTGVVGLGKGKKATLLADPKSVTPGTLVGFRLKFTKKLRKRLKELDPSKKLRLRITASTTNLAGVVTEDQTRIQLKGQAPPQ